MAFTYVPLTGQWRRADGSAQVGSVTLVPTVAFTNSSVTVSGATTYRLDATGSVNVSVAATNDAGTSPSNAMYVMYVQLAKLPVQIITTIIPNNVSSISINNDLPWPTTPTFTPTYSPAVAYATFVALPLNTYNNGTSGVGATLTGQINGTLFVDGQAVTVGQRILVKNEVAQPHNGIYVVSQPGSASTVYVLTRTNDFNSPQNIGPGVQVTVRAPIGVAGVNNDGTQWLSTGVVPFVVGTSGVQFLPWPDTTSADISTSTPGDSASPGSSARPAAADHKHARETFATSATTIAYGTGEFAGTALTDSRGDHVHGMPGFDTNALHIQLVGTIASSPGSSGLAVQSDHVHEINVAQVQAAVGGGGGGGGAQVVYYQSVPAASATIDHGLNRFPTVITVDSSGTEIEGNIFYVDSNHVTITFSAPFTWTAYIS